MMSEVIELAKTLAAWTVDPGVVEPRVPYEQRNTIPLEEITRQLSDYNAQAYGTINGTIRRFIELFTSVSPQERTEARKIIRENGRRPIWQALEQWSPDEHDYAKRIRLRLACLAITWGMTDYRDDLLGMNSLAKQVGERGLDWTAFHAEYEKLAADFTPNLIGVSASPEISEGQAANEIATLTAAIAEHPDSADVYYQRALTYMKSHDFQRAIDDFSAALRIDNYNAEYRYQRGTAYAAAGNVKAAFNDYVDVVSKAPGHAHADEIRDRIKEWRSLR